MANETKKYGINDQLKSISWHMKRIADQLELLNNRLDDQDPFSYLGNTDKPSKQVKNESLKQMLERFKNH